MPLINELRRRNVHRIALAYVAGAWLVVQVAETLLPAFGYDADRLRDIVILLAIGFIPALILSWKFEWTPSGLVRDADVTAGERGASTRTLDRAITLCLVAAVAYFAIDKYMTTETEPGDSIAVVPFANNSNDPEQDYFGGGIATELSKLLTSIPGLRVVSWSDWDPAASRSSDIDAVAKAVDADYVLHGNVRKAGNLVRVAVQLVDMRTDTLLWSNVYERPLDDIFAVQDDISARVVGHLRLELANGPPTSQEINPRAYELYLKGKHLTHTVRTPEAFEEAEEILSAVVDIEPAYVPALWELARTLLNRTGSGDPVADKDAMDRIRVLVDRMVELAPDSSYANGFLSFYAREEGDLEAYSRYVERAVADLGSPNVYLQQTLAAQWLVQLGRVDEAYALAEYAVDRDPACSVCVTFLSTVARAAGRNRESAEVIEDYLQWQSEAPDGLHWYAGRAWLIAGEPAKALGHFEQETNPVGALGRLLALHDLGRSEEFEAGFAALKEEQPPNYEAVARVAAWTGQNDLAFEYLDRLVERYGPQMARNVKTDLYGPIKSDPRWQAFLERNDASKEHFLQVSFNPTLPPEVEARLAELESGL